MRLFAITTHGLIAITMSVAALWACLAVERNTQRRADRDLRVSQIVLARLRANPVPASQPANPFHTDRPASS